MRQKQRRTTDPTRPEKASPPPKTTRSQAGDPSDNRQRHRPKANSRAIHCHVPRATFYIAGCKNSIRHIENRFSPYFTFVFFNAVRALTSGGFRIVSDTLCLIKEVGDIFSFVFNLHGPVVPLRSFSQNFNTNCSSPSAIRRCKNIAEKFNLLSRAHERHRRQTY